MLSVWRIGGLSIAVILAVNVYNVSTYLKPVLIEAPSQAGPEISDAPQQPAAETGVRVAGAVGTPEQLRPEGRPVQKQTGAQATGTRDATRAPVLNAVGEAACPGRKGYHTVLTATGQVYQQWQCRIMYRHWLKQRALDPRGKCTEMTGFTRLVASIDARPDGVEDEVPSLFVKEYGGADLSRFHGYRVINRPYSVVQMIDTFHWRERIWEEYIMIAETDHIFMHPVPNTATLGSPMAYVFNYMGPNPAFEELIRRAWKVGTGESSTAADYKQVQPIGPSPVVIHKSDLEKIAPVWHQKAIALKMDKEAEKKLGWVIEMWGYAVAAASLGLEHQLFEDFQVEPGALSTQNQLNNFLTRYWILHYTYQFEYYLDGQPCKPWTIGEYSLDKRHFSGQYPPRPLPEPPAKANVAAFWLVRALNEGMANISTWPDREGGGRPKSVAISAQTVYGRRRADWFGRHANGFATEKKMMPLISSLIGTSWSCAGQDTAFSLKLDDGGDAQSAGRKYRWASMNNPELSRSCPVGNCIYMDSGGNLANVHVADEISKLVARDAASSSLSEPLWTCTRS